jgi:membrane fusion protein, heavy metal efflux system
MKNSIALALVLVACSEEDHAHGPNGEHPNEQAPERPALSVTLYQSGMELFMEYEAFVVGEESPLIAHFTDARDPNQFHAVTKGSVTATLRYSDGTEEKFVADENLRDGIFKPIVKPSKKGEGTLELVLTGPQVAGTIDVGSVVVHGSTADAIAAAPKEEQGERQLPFLKEQQWKTEYATAPVEQRVLQGGVRANGELRPVAGQSAELSAPVAARIPVGDEVPFLGQPVIKGQLLLRLLPTAVASGMDIASIDLDVERARAELGLAEREVKRAEELLAAKAIPEKDLDAARVAKDVAAAKLGAAQRQRALFKSTQTGGSAGAGAAFELRSPLDGVVSFADVNPGAVVEAGTRLVAVVNTEKLWLESKVYEPEAPLVERSPGATFTVAGFDREFTVDERNGRLVAVGAVVDRSTRTVPVIFELTNPGGALKPGMFAKVTLFTGQTVRSLAIPESAVVDDNGRPAVFVMAGGEAFFKRAIKVGIRSGGLVQAIEGLSEGERVVSRGAYEIKLVAASGGIPEHGHQH